MIRARAELVLRQPFFGSLALHLELKADSSCRHLWTDGRTLGFNPVWAATLPHERLVGAQAHEVMHLACAHHVRRNGRDARLWNEACDVVVDALLLGAGFRLPQGHLEHPEYAGLSVDEVYGRLAALQDTPLHGGAQQQAAGRRPREKEASRQEHDGKERQDTPAAAPSREGKTDDAAPEAAGKARPAGDKPEKEQPVPYFSGEVRDHPLLEDGQGDARHKAEQEAELRLEQALQRARHMGREPAGFSRLLRGGRHDGGTDWRGLLRRFLENCALNDYTWSAPNRRYLHHGIYLPGRQEQRIPQLAVAVDCSGSVDDAALSLFCAELSSILAAYETELVVIFHDSRVQAVRTFRRQDLPLHLSPVGGGGTDFKPVAAGWTTTACARPACSGSRIWNVPPSPTNPPAPCSGPSGDREGNSPPSASCCVCPPEPDHQGARMRITWKIEKKRGNLRPVLTYAVTLEDFERELATPPLSITSLIPEPPESWQEHCWPGQHERAGQDTDDRPCYQLSIPSHKGRHGSQSLRLPWREDNSYPEVEASFRLLREAFEKELERAGASRPMHEENSLELGGTALRTVAPAILGQRFLAAVGKA